MRLWCVAVGLFGLVMAAGAFGATDGPALALLDLYGGDGSGPPDGDLRITLAVLGAVMVGWALTLLAAFDAADELGPRGDALRRRITVAVAVWFVLDSVLSIATGFAGNALANVAFLAAYAAAARQRSAVMR